MGKKAVPGLEWIDRNAAEQQKWAFNYLAAKGIKVNRHPLYGGLQDIGKDLERSAEGLLTLKAMKNAWRQKKCRLSRDGRKPYTFTLPIAVKKDLSHLAKLSKTNETSLLIDLIRNEFKQQKEIKSLRSEFQRAKAEAADYKRQLETMQRKLEALETCAEKELSAPACEQHEPSLESTHEESCGSDPAKRKIDIRKKYRNLASR